MPIVNGTYVYDQLPTGTSSGQQSGWIEQAFGPGKFSGKDWSDTKTAAYNYLLKQQENAFNVEMWNEMNKYNSPAAQMQRYLEAGLNPNLIYSQQNTTSPLQAASNAAFRSQGTQAKRVQNQLSTIQMMQGLVESAGKTYDYFKYQVPAKGMALLKAQAEAGTARYNELWNQYLMTGEGPFGNLDEKGNLSSPRAIAYKNQQDLTLQNIERVKFMVNSLLPTQEARLKALTALDHYQYDMMHGRYGAILDVHTGLGETVDNWVRLIMFMAIANMF